MTTEAEAEEIIDVGMETKEDHLVPSSPTLASSTTPVTSPTGQPQSPPDPPTPGSNLILSPQSPFQAYSARLRSEADYER